MSTFNIANPIKIVNPNANLDSRYGPWMSVADANSNITQGLRQLGLTVGVSSIATGVVEYWYKNGIQNTDLVLKTSGGGGGFDSNIFSLTATWNSSSSILSSLSSTWNSSSSILSSLSTSWNNKQNFIGTVALTSTNFLQLLANRNFINYELSATLAGFGFPHGTAVANNKIYISRHLGSGGNGQIIVINDPFGNLSNQTLITLTGETNIPALCYHKQTDRIYGIVSSNTGDRIIRFNPNNNTYDIFYTLTGGEANTDSCIINDDEYLYVGVFPKVFRIRISDATLVNTYQNGFNLQNIHSIRLSPDGRYILCTNDSTGGNFHRINIQTGVVDTIGFGRTFTDDTAVLGDYFYCLSEDSGGVAYKINWKDLTWRMLYTGRPGWGVFTDERFVYFLHNYVGSPGGIPTPTSAAFIYKYDPENESWHTIYLATTIPLLDVANRINEIIFIGDKVFLTNYNTDSDKIFRSQIKTEVTTVPALEDNRTNWDINSPANYRLVVNSGNSDQWSSSYSLVNQNSSTWTTGNVVTSFSISSNNAFIIDVSKGNTFFQGVDRPEIYSYSNFTTGKTIVFFLSGGVNVFATGDDLLHQFPPNTYFNNVGESNYVLTITGKVTKITLTNINNRYYGSTELFDLNYPNQSISSGGSGTLLDGLFGYLLLENGDRLLQDDTPVSPLP